NARREVFIRVDFPPHVLEDAGDQIAGRKAAVSGLPSEHHLDVVADHPVPPCRARRLLLRALYRIRLKGRGSVPFQYVKSTMVSVISPAGRCHRTRAPRFAPTSARPSGEDHEMS